jgi:recombination protein RecA
MSLDFLKGVERDLEKSGIAVGSSEPPRYWFSTGNYVLNKIISGSFLRGIPQGRLLCFTGPSGAGKSFLAANAMREAQKEGAHIVVLDSENALDDDFVSAIGVDPSQDYTYVAVDTIPQTKKVVSSVIKGYKSEYGDRDPDAPKLLLVIDSLDMLMTETEQEHFDKGVTKGDQGQRNKQLKAMLREFVQAVKHPNISIIVTAQVYKNQDVLNGEGVWIVSDAIKFSLSQVVLLTKLKLKETGSREVQGIRMKCEGYKTRFTKPFQTVTIEVPYDTGMDPYNGLLDVAVDMGVCEKKGSRYALAGDDKTWYAKDFGQYAADVLAQCEAKREKFLEAMIEDHELDLSEGPRSKSRRKAKAEGGE